MMPESRRITITLILLIASNFVVAADKMYKWIDKDGKVHYSDKRPVDANNITEISEALKPINRSRAAEETVRLKEVFPEENEAEQAYRRRKDREHTEEKREHLKACERARADLKVLQGRVIFIDKNGERYTVSETERARRAKELEILIDKNC